VTTDWKIGDLIEGRWEVHHIFKGGMGVVNIVYDHQHRMPYAVKTFFADKPGDDSDKIADFTQEALTWINLDVHENVTRAEFVETISGKPYLFLEFVSGGDLSRWIGTPLLAEDLPQVLRFAIQLCDGMIHAAAKGIEVHRDIKPRNCLITEDNILKVTDFGLAKAFHVAKSARKNKQSPAEKMADANAGRSASATGAGTCTHMAPEQFDDVAQVDVRADIYSFGVLLFQMITGKLPFPGDTWDELKQQHQTQAPAHLPVSLPGPLSELVSRCLAKNPRDRFADFLTVRRQLAQLYEQLTGARAPHAAVGAKLDAIGWSNKGASLSNLQRHEEALDCYDRALGLDPQLKEAWNNKGSVLRSMQQYAKALACYDHALALDSSFAPVWNNKGLTLESLGRHADAVACYDHAVDANPQFKEAWHNRGLVWQTLRRHREALSCYDRVIALDPANAEVYSQKGSSLQALGCHVEALACYDQALTLDSGSAEVWAQKGWSLRAVGRHAEALSCYTQALALDPDVVPGKFRRWAARALLSCQRLFKTPAKPAD
jgi:serine/threonine protein kinase